MRGQLNFLNVTQVKAAKIKDKEYRLNDGGNLYLLVRPNGTKIWRMKYTVKGKTKLASFGRFPKVTLKRARELRQIVGEQAEQGIDYNKVKHAERDAQKAAKDENFKAVAELWIKRMGAQWTPRHAGVVQRSLEQDVYPYIGKLHVREIDSSLILETASRIADERGAHDVARRVLRRISSVMEFAAIVLKDADKKPLIPVNPAIGVKKYLPENKANRKHHPAIKHTDLPDFVWALDQSDMFLQTRLAIQLLMLTFVRSGELRFARWDEFDMKEKTWKIPSDRMKMNNEHIVPLSRQAIEVLEQLKTLAGDSDLVVPGRSTTMKPISENTMLFGIYRIGYKDRMSGHGFRRVASSWLNEKGEFMYRGAFPDGKTRKELRRFNPDAIERQLAHGEPDKVRDCYNEADYMGERPVMMQVWADFIDRCHDTSGKIVPIKRESA